MYDIYEFSDKRDDQSIYIGLTDNLDRRIKEHLRRKVSPIYPLAQELKQEGLELRVSVLQSLEGLQDARHAEKSWIQKRKPLLNTHHNMLAVHDRYEEEMYTKRISEAMQDMGLSYKEAILFTTYFCVSEGDLYNYKIIRSTTQLARRRSGLEPFTESEVLDLALESYRVEQYS